MHIGVIADDFTGGLDAAGFIKKSGENVTLFNGLPGEGDLDAVGKDDSAVIAMQIRSIDSKIASDEAEKAALLLKKAGARMIYFKYCSTFDSTEKGNIGPIIERLMKVLSVTSTILVPSLPVNGRTVKDGILYVNGVELSSSPMRYHPLNPMTISYIPEILRRQSSPDLPIHLISHDVEEKRKVYDREAGAYVIDAEDDYDVMKIAKEFHDIPFATGGSALPGAFASLEKKGEEKKVSELVKADSRKTIMFVGSCSASSLEQVEAYRSIPAPVHHVSVEKSIFSRDEYIKEIVSLASSLSGEYPLLVSASKSPKERRESDEKFPGYDIAKYTEEFFSLLFRAFLEKGYTRFIVGGGETSGSVVRASGMKAFEIGREIAPGVSWMYSGKIGFALKSGNFGGKSFFSDVLYE